MPFAKQQLAGSSEGQQKANSISTSRCGSFAPFLQQGTEALGQGIGWLQELHKNMSLVQ